MGGDADVRKEMPCPVSACHPVLSLQEDVQT